MSSEKSLEGSPPKRSRLSDGNERDALTFGIVPDDNERGMDSNVGNVNSQGSAADHGNDGQIKAEVKEELMNSEDEARDPAAEDLQRNQDVDIKMEPKDDESTIDSDTSDSEDDEDTTDKDTSEESDSDSKSESESDDEMDRSASSRSSSRTSSTSSSSSDEDSSRHSSPEADNRQNVRNPNNLFDGIHGGFRRPCCAKCANHGTEVLKIGHKNDCTYKTCDCAKCRVTDEYNDAQRMRRQNERERKNARLMRQRLEDGHRFDRDDDEETRGKDDDDEVDDEEEEVDDDEEKVDDEEDEDDDKEDEDSDDESEEEDDVKENEEKKDDNDNDDD